MVEQSAFELTEGEDVPMQEPHDPLSQTILDNEYAFQQTMTVHTGSVRSLATHSAGDILMSGSIDMTNKIFSLNN